ncbi:MULTISPECIES: hypothetical protein [Lysinibacillus]|uniref:hypothetical protein n=1 Tax=Lysinibacillus TaxID=400634 RepID=UPI00214CB263|nr:MULTISPECIES: hypothetical protein [Lysinibacillus]UUV24341.1 hypothetical protein NP781_21560 [Lysinibacillus sp. FN11]UYB47214.1 hypothetical protein OCI51_24175 [Lysinibacillus capsici]
MSIKPNNVTLTFEGVAKSDRARLIGIRPLVDFNTKAQIGFTYEVLLEENGFNKIQIKVENQPPLLTMEQLSEAKEPVYIMCQGFESKFYMSDRTRSYEITCKASKVTIAKA